MTTITLTEDQRRQVKEDMDEKIEMLSDEEVEALASKLNDAINIPILRTGTEQTVFVKIVKQVDRALYKNLPNEIYGLVQSTTDGISDEDADNLRLVLATRLNKKINIPYVPEYLEQKIFELLIGLIVAAMRNNVSILNPS